MDALARLVAGLLFAALMIAQPAQALDAARQALGVWATAFVPALLPFFAVTGALSSDEAAALYARVFGRVFEALFGCPGRLAGAALIGLMAGSPAGAIAADRLRGDATPAQLARGALIASGLSPGFLIGAVGTAVLGDPSMGAVLFRSQLGALFIGGLVMRRAFSGGQGAPPQSAAGAPAGEKGLIGAALAMLSVGAYMVMFGVAARLISLWMPPGAEAFVLAAMEISGGSAALAALPVAQDVRTLLLAFACGFGGLSILAQNLQRLRGVRLGWYLSGKLLHGGLCALLCWAQMGLPQPELPAAGWRMQTALACWLVLATAAGAFALKRARRSG